MPRALTIAELQQKASSDPQSLTVQQLEQIRRVKKIQEAAKPDAGSRYVVLTQKEVAHFFGRSVDRIKQWTGEGMPREGHSQYDLCAIARWRLNRKAEVAVDDEEKAERVKLIRSRRLAADQRRRIEAGHLVEKDEVERNQCARIYAIKGGLEALGRCLSRELVNVPDAATVQQRIDAATYDLLLSFAEDYDGEGDFLRSPDKESAQRRRAVLVEQNGE